MLNFSQAWLVFMVDVSLKALLLFAATGLCLLALRLRDTNLRHRVWTAVLVGMLAMPLLVGVTPAIPLPSWMTAWIHLAPLEAVEPDAVPEMPPTAAELPLPASPIDRFDSPPDFASSGFPAEQPFGAEPFATHEARTEQPAFPAVDASEALAPTLFA